MAFRDYSTSPSENTSLFPEGMPRAALNDGMRVVQSDIRGVVNELPFYDVGTGTGAATFAFVSSNSFNVLNVDATTFYPADRRVRITGSGLGTRFGTITSSTFVAPNTRVVVDLDGTVNLLNETIAVAVSVVDTNSLPTQSINNDLLLSSTDPSAAVGPKIELFRDSASPAIGDTIGRISFTGRDSVATKTNYLDITGRIENPTNGIENSSLIFNHIRNGVPTSIAKLAFGRLEVIRDDNTSIAGPSLRLTRLSNSPTDNDPIGLVKFGGKNSSLADVDFGSIESIAEDITASTENGQIIVRVIDNGTSKQVMTLTGASSFINNSAVVTVADQVPLILNRQGTDGTLVSFQKNSVQQGQIFVSGSTVTYSTFTGGHESEIENMEERDPPLGTLLSSCDSWYDQSKGLPNVEVTKKPGCNRVYGVFGGRTETGIMANSLGIGPHVRCVGPVQAGDLLRASEQPGMAERQDDDIVRASTLGKSLVTDLRTTDRLIAFTNMAG